jgi:hypothetical protein
VAELADAALSKSVGRQAVRVRIPPSAPPGPAPQHPQRPSATGRSAGRRWAGSLRPGGGPRVASSVLPFPWIQTSQGGHGWRRPRVFDGGKGPPPPPRTSRYADLVPLSTARRPAVWGVSGFPRSFPGLERGPHRMAPNPTGDGPRPRGPRRWEGSRPAGGGPQAPTLPPVDQQGHGHQKGVANEDEDEEEGHRLVAHRQRPVPAVAGWRASSTSPSPSRRQISATSSPS